MITTEFLTALLSLTGYALATTNLTARGLTNAFPLTVLCIGDSITVGVGSDDTNGPDSTQDGYRHFLYDNLVAADINPKFVGSYNSGTNNPQPYYEAIGGTTINAMYDFLHTDRPWSEDPNLILLHAGTNDMVYGNDGDNPDTGRSYAPTRLSRLIDYILCQAPNAVVLVALIISNTAFRPADQRYTDIYNSHIPDVIGTFYQKGYKIRGVDMTNIAGDLKHDDLHPNPQGYLLMADQWMTAIQGIPDDWWSVSQSSQVATSTVETCARDAISFSPLIGGSQLLQGFHANGDTADVDTTPGSSTSQWAPGWKDQGIIALGSGYPGGGVHLIDLDGDGRTDYLWVNLTAGSEGSVYAWLNEGPGTWVPLNGGNLIAFGYPDTSYVELADLDHDGKPELIYVADGQFKIYHNGGQNGQVWNWSEMPAAENELNYIFPTVPFHWFADLTGDGYADLIVENSNSVLDLYINLGADGNGGFTWHQCLDIGIAAEGTIIWADIDGDGKADYIALDSDSGASGWLNGYTSGCEMHWSPINGRSPKSLALGVGTTDIRFVDMTGDGKADICSIDDGIGSVRLFMNVGSLQQPDDSAIGGFAAAARLADMDGDGLDDYASVTTTSGVAVTLNEGQSDDGQSWKWSPQANANIIALGFGGGTRHQVLLADMNADGRADYVWFDDDTGALHCYLNLGPDSAQSWHWNVMGEIAIGVGGDGKGVRLADFNGDGRADYIWINGTDGSVRVWLNTGPDDNLSTWIPVNGGGIAALGTGAFREDVHFADIDGDLRADYIWVHPDTGDAQVWYNTFDGTTVGWIPGGVIMSGSGYPGNAIQFGHIGSQSGRSDYAALDQDSGAMRVWTNNCGNVIATKQRPAAGRCGSPPMASRTTSEAIPAATAKSIICDPFDDDACDAPDECDFSLTFTTIADLKSVFQGDPCAQYYAIDTLQTVLKDALTNYTTVNDGYDLVFGYYQEYMRNAINQTLQDYMADPTKDNLAGGPGNKYFDCVWSQNGGPSKRIQCPIPYGTADTDYGVDCEWILTNSTGFYYDLATRHAILKDWVTFKNYTWHTGSDTCSPTGTTDNGADCGAKTYHYKDHPEMADNIDIPNPKDTITAAMPGIVTIQNQMIGQQINLWTGRSNSTPDDIIQIYSVPIFMIQSAVDSMATAKQLGQKQEEQDELKILGDVLAVVFFFIPFLDAAGPAIEVADGFFNIVAQVGGAIFGALTAVQQIVTNSQSAPIAIFNFLLGLGGNVGNLHVDEDVQAVAAARRGAATKGGALDIGDVFHDHDQEFQDAIELRCMD